MERQAGHRARDHFFCAPVIYRLEQKPLLTPIVRRQPVVHPFYRNPPMSSASRYSSLRFWCRLLAGCSLAILLFAWPLAAGVLAAPIVDTHGFESGFSPGALEGQDGWVKSSFSPTGSGGVDTSTATIQSITVDTGSKALQVEKSANYDSRWIKPVAGLGFPNHRFILVDWDMNVTATGAPSGVFGPFLGVDTYDVTGGPSVLGSLGVDATTGEVLYQAATSGVILPTGASVNFGSWHHFQIKLDFGLDQYQVLLDGAPLASANFVDGVSNTFSDADIAAFAVSADTLSQGQTATAYYDNFLVRDVSQADFDIDGDVDGVDLAAWQSAYGATLAADADLDGDSDGADFLIWQREYDPTGPLTSPISAVPEPSTLTLAVLTLGLFLRPSLRLCR